LGLGARGSNVCEQFRECELHTGDSAAHEFVRELVTAYFAVGEALGLTEDFDGALVWQHDPVFAHASFGVNLRERTVVVSTGDGDFDGERSGGRVGVKKSS